MEDNLTDWKKNAALFTAGQSITLFGAIVVAIMQNKSPLQVQIVQQLDT